MFNKMENNYINFDVVYSLDTKKICELEDKATETIQMKS